MVQMAGMGDGLREKPRLSAFAKSGGCGCKVNAGVLRQWLAPLHAAVKGCGVDLSNKSGALNDGDTLNDGGALNDGGVLNDGDTLNDGGVLNDGDILNDGVSNKGSASIKGGASNKGGFPNGNDGLSAGGVSNGGGELSIKGGGVLNDNAIVGGGGLLVGGEFCDDAAVWQTSVDSAVVASADFFAPVVDDGEDFGAIAAANALSDIYAMGARPLFALALTAMPEAVDDDTVKQILQGGADVCHRAGVVVAGGHSIRSAEPLYGLCVIGNAHPQKILTNGNAKVGDVLILGKPLGAGLLSAAHRKGKLPQQQYASMTAVMKTLNSAGLSLAALDGAHSLTDITGFGLLGHLLEMCRASGVNAELCFDKLPLMIGAAQLAKDGGGTGGGRRNRRDCQDEVIFVGDGGDDDMDDWKREILYDPQTSGGLLLACAPDVADDALAIFHKHNCKDAAVVGQCISANGTSKNKSGVIVVKT